MAKGHKLYTERVNGGVIAECRGDNCDWSGKYKYQKFDKSTRASVTAEDSVFPNRQLAVNAHTEHHKETNNG